MSAGAQRNTGMLAVDVGNTVTRMGLFVEGVLRETWDATTPDRLTADEARLVIQNFLDLYERQSACEHNTNTWSLDAIVSCVVPTLTEVWVSALQRQSGRRPLLVGPGLKTGLKMHYRDPAEVGPDRVADLVAAKAEYETPLVVVDLGTTTNFEVLDEQGAFLGGIIAPGLSLSARSLAEAAARLPLIELKAPAKVIGTSTREAMQAGVVMGEVARIDGLIDMIFAEFGSAVPILITGTDSATMAALLTHEACADDTLTLKGLYRLYEMNRRA